ncbi:ATP-dependent DNA helicase Q1-like [Ruditapes philippinarum]|uniref:ATP-dependent DNA helicase Q1-like n=1 Tax=Ruditapes philippinarum TaxID=129788 RepID=UPI00295B0991|nr:ATP-dependent DNA helicase Q1-like [Ruditapes philippinarum]
MERVALTSFDLQLFQERRIADAITNYNIHVGAKISTLKENQRSAVKYLVEGKDCICSLPTGYGKSLIYELLPFLDTGCLVDVVVPLNAILNQQMENLLMKNVEIISESPAKDNISLTVKRRPSPTASGNSSTTPYDYIFHPVITKLKHELQDFEIIIIYCKSMQWIGYGYETARRILGTDFYAGDSKLEHARVVMFHSSMEKESGQLKNMILTTLQKPDAECQIRLIISSVALGMGADLKNVKRIIHAGPPTTLEAYIQEIGRAGRTGSVAEAVLYFNNSDISGQCMRKDMQDYCRNNEKCRRDIINEHFGFQTKEKPTICCNFCDSQLCIEWDFF